jgi:hypothetical protein
LPDNRIQVLLIDRPEYEIEGHEQKNEGDGNDQNYTAVNGGPDFYVFVQNRIP